MTTPKRHTNECMNRMQRLSGQCSCGPAQDVSGLSGIELCYELHNQLTGYIDPSTPDDLKRFLIRQSQIVDHILDTIQAASEREAKLAVVLEKVRDFVVGHDEGCEMDLEYGAQTMALVDEILQEEDEDAPVRDWPRQAVCGCGYDELSDEIDAALEGVRYKLNKEYERRAGK